MKNDLLKNKTRRKNIDHNRRGGQIGLFLYFLRLTMRENRFQSKLIKELEKLFPGCIITKLDPGNYLGIPDLLILYNDRWAVLECKASRNATHEPGQDYYVDLMDKMSFASFIFPENKKEVLNELQRAFSSSRSALISKCQ